MDDRSHMPTRRPTSPRRAAAYLAVAVTVVLPTSLQARQESPLIADQPSLSVGSVDDVATAFQRITGILSTSGGGLIVADGGLANIRFFDAGGQLVRTVGRSGGGPGEYQQLAGLFRGPADSLYAFDFNGSRVSVLSDDGTFVRSMVLSPPSSAPGRPALSGILDNGQLIVDLYLTGGDGRPDGHQIWRYNADGSPDAPRATLPGRLVGSSNDGEMRLEMILPWGAMPHSAVVNGELLAGHGAENRVVRMGVGRVELRLPDEDRRRLTDDVVEAFIEQLVARAPAQVRSRLSSQMDPMREAPRAEFLPYFTAIRGTPTGGAWLERFVVPGDARRRWDRFGADGSWLGAGWVPGNVTVLSVESGSVLAVVEDDLGVQTARRYSIR